MNVYEEALRILRKKISVRQLVADLHSEDLRKMIERLVSSPM
ncbi:hypothetical protein [Endozoicomonas atrinae]|nr:hypothetical protein [Endozoicomonas atrinae]